MPYDDPNDPKKLIDEAHAFFVRVASGCRAYSKHELEAAIIKMAEYLHALAKALEGLIAKQAHVFAQVMREIEAHDLSPSLANLAE